MSKSRRKIAEPVLGRASRQPRWHAMAEASRQAADAAADPEPDPMPPVMNEAEAMYARAALACYSKALAADDPDQIATLIEAGAWFARLGPQDRPE